MSHPEFTIEYLDPAQLSAHPANFRRHPDLQKSALARSIEEHSWLAAPIANRRTGMTLVDGHARVEIALSRGEAAIPVRVIDVSAAEEKQILATFDRVGALAVPDDRALAALLQELAESPAGLPAGWEDDDLAGLLETLGESEGGGLLPDADPDAIPEEVETRVKAGELWACGRHRVLCADATEAASVARLMGQEEAALCFTSPPYLQQRQYESGVGDWDLLMRGVFEHVPVDGGQILVNLGLVHRDGEWVPYWDDWLEWMRGEGWRRFGFYVWDQGPGLPGDWNGRLAPAHEFIFHFNRTAEKARKTMPCKGAGEQRRASQKGLRQADGSVSEYTHAGRAVQETKIPDSVFRVMRHKARGVEVGHPAIFPVRLAQEVIEAFSDAGDGVYDPLSGSGTTLIACEATGRSARCIEREPIYVDLCLARYELATGQSAERLS